MPTPSPSALLTAPMALCILALGTLAGCDDKTAGKGGAFAGVRLPTPEERMKEPGMAARGAAVFEKSLCMSCHGKLLEGGVGPCLTDAAWLKGSGFADILKSISEGAPQKGMPPFAALPEDDKIALVAFIQSRAQGLRDVKYKLYEGAWPKLPDFAALTPKEEGLLKADEAVDLAKFGRASNFGVVYGGQLLIPESGAYHFQLASDDGAVLLVDGSPVVDNDGVHNDKIRKQGEAQLKAGSHPFELRYFQAGGGTSLKLTWDGPVSGGYLTLPVSTPEVIMVLGQARVLRGNIRGQTGAPMLAMGFPGGVNIAMDTDLGTIPLAWRGDFLDVGGSRLNRGENANLPLGEKVVPLAAQPLLRLEGKPGEAPEFLGYRLAGAQVVLHWRLGGARFDQTLAVAGNGGGISATLAFLDPVPGPLLLLDASGKTRTVPADEARILTVLLPF